ncbi:hypothetical protein QQS21_004914 [Conoideocrella luteorostrata]|uniref:Uncharacterized protein n=1 Tax=Conoideocrella luteorostrata TaxID=1105319 RepID=A0AAJ0FV03_9HYPO|nr:hypothetical protein QQS21_004914 [Conoideocrella luteorostrata]
MSLPNSTSGSRYVSISNDDDDGDDIHDKPFLASEKHPAERDPFYPRTRRPYSFTMMQLLALILTSAIIGLTLGLTSYLINTTTTPSVSEPVRVKTMVKPCGTTSAEARKRGCHFDPISFCWLPTACYDKQLTRDFDVGLEWYLDANRTQPVSHEQIMTGEYTGLYVNWEYHVSHCTAMWKKMHRAIMSGLGNAAIDSYIGMYAHTAHCEKMLLKGRNIAGDVINTRIRVKFPDCGMDYTSRRREQLHG